jgi:F5/8 type C domain
VAVSGTVSMTVFNTRKVIDHAYRRCRIPPEGISSEQISFALDTLYLILSMLANRGLQLWCIERYLMPLYQAQGLITMPNGIVDILNTNLRTVGVVNQNTNNTTTSTTYTTIFPTVTQVTTIGIEWSGASTSYALETSDNGTTWTTLATESNPNATANTVTWVDVQGALATSYFRVRATSGTLNQSQVILANTPNEIPMARLNRDDYVNLPNKAFEGRPLQFWVDRLLNAPVLYLWPVPSAQFVTAQVVVWVKRYIMDVGTMTQEIEVPQRWYDAIVYVLASRLAEETPTVDPQMIAILDQKAQRSLLEAENEERDDSPIYLTPNIAVYTR